MAIDYFGAVKGIGEAITWIIIIVALGVIIGIFMLLLGYKHRVRVREVVKGRTRVIDDRAKQVKDKSGVYWWKFLKTKLKVSIPPDSAKDLTRKGKIVAEGYLVNGTDFVWANTNFDESFHKVGIDQKFKPFTSQQRALLVAEYEQAEAYKKTPLSELIVKAMPYIALIMILTIFMIFFGEVTTPVKQLSEQQEATAAQMTILVGKMDDVINNKQTIIQSIEEEKRVSGLPPGGVE